MDITKRENGMSEPEKQEAELSRASE